MSQNSKITSAMLCVCVCVCVCVLRYRNGIQTWIFLPWKPGPVNFLNPFENFFFNWNFSILFFPTLFHFPLILALLSTTTLCFSLSLSLSCRGLSLVSLAQAVKERGSSDKISWRSTALINWSCFVPLSYDVRPKVLGLVEKKCEKC